MPYQKKTLAIIAIITPAATRVNTVIAILVNSKGTTFEGG